MHITVLGLNHNTAPLDIREKLYISEEAAHGLLGELKAAGAQEAAVISTCNRTEVYVTGPEQDAQGRAAIDVLTGRFGADSLSSYTYLLTDEEAYRHLFLVASGLDSMVIGEPQILGQVKDAYRSASGSGAAGPFLEKVFNRAFQVAKRVRSETRIGYNPVSISAMAVDLARKIFGALERKQILVVGAGEMCEIALKHFRKEGLGEVLVTNRTFAAAQQLAEQIIGTAHPFEALADLLVRVDMVLSSTGSEKPIIDKPMVMDAMKKRKMRPLFFIDIAVPRDVQPAVNNIENVYLYDIDDLKDLSQAHLSEQGRGVPQGARYRGRRGPQILAVARPARPEPGYRPHPGASRCDERQGDEKDAPKIEGPGRRDRQAARPAHAVDRQQDRPSPSGRA